MKELFGSMVAEAVTQPLCALNAHVQDCSTVGLTHLCALCDAQVLQACQLSHPCQVLAVQLAAGWASNVQLSELRQGAQLLQLCGRQMLQLSDMERLEPWERPESVMDRAAAALVICCVDAVV